MHSWEILLIQSNGRDRLPGRVLLPGVVGGADPVSCRALFRRERVDVHHMSKYEILRFRGEWPARVLRHLSAEYVLQHSVLGRAA